MRPISPAGGGARAPSQPAAAPALWKSISSLRGLAMCLVVANHATQSASGIYFTAHPTVAPAASPWAFAIVLVLRALTPVCLVAFFFASGFMAFRFLADGKASRAAAAQVARKYLLWSGAVLAVRALGRRGMAVGEIGKALVLGDAQPAYWFLVVLPVLLVSAPVWARLVRTRARWGFLAAAALQAGACAFFYLSLGRGEVSTLETFVVRPLQFLPAFVAGMWVSRNAARVSELVSARRRPLAALAVLAGAASLLESWLLGELIGAEPIRAVFATERATLVLFGFATIAALIGREPRSPRLASWLKSVGSSSLGIMLLMDLCIHAVIAAVWQVPPLFSATAAAARAEHRLPPWIVDRALWLIPVLFAVGLWGPLGIMARAERLAGNRVRHLW